MNQARKRVARVDRKLITLALAAAALVLSLLGITAPLERPMYRYLFILDITQSMNTLDYMLDDRPASRLAYAKTAIQYAMANMPCGSQVGLGVFTEHRSMVLLAPVEVCAAYTELTATLARLDWRMAWAGASEVAKGLNSALRLTRELEAPPTVVFVSDGHEAPPVSRVNRFRFGGEPGAVTGLIVGAGGAVPRPIPKYDMSGNPLGYWGADEVVQIEGTGRQGSDSGESMVDSEGRALVPMRAGAEHLSTLKESYLRALAQDTGLQYRRLTTPADLQEALTVREWARPAKINVDLRPAAGLIAFVCLIGAYGGGALYRALRTTRIGSRRKHKH